MTPGCDRRFFALNVTEPGHASVVIPKRLLAPGGRLYGGSILALSFAMMEQHSKRPAVWCAAQMVSPAKPKELLMLSLQRVQEWSANGAAARGGHRV